MRKSEDGNGKWWCVSVFMFLLGCGDGKCKGRFRVFLI